MSFQPSRLSHSCQPTKNRLRIGTAVTIPVITRSRRSLTIPAQCRRQRPLILARRGSLDRRNFTTERHASSSGSLDTA